MANGIAITIQKQVLLLTYTVKNLQGRDTFFPLDLDDRFDIILGMTWLIRHQPVIN